MVNYSDIDRSFYRSNGTVHAHESWSHVPRKKWAVKFKRAFNAR